jgi:pimeloyl-ACP methyl ester carboxylesterase
MIDSMNRRRLILTAPAMGLAAIVPTGVAAQAGGFRSDRIVVETRGPARPAGPDVILIPGIASTGEVWDRTARGLTGRRRVHVVSVRGFGAVPAGANVSGRVIEPVAAEVRRYVQEMRLPAPALIGHSMGGLIALEAAAGSGMGRIMVVDGLPFFPALAGPQTRVADIEPLARLGFQALRLLGDEGLRNASAAIGGGHGMGGLADMVFNGVGWQGGDRAVLAQSLYEVMTLDLRPRLPHVSAPVTVVYGWSPDSANPRAQLEGRLREAWRGLRAPPRFERIEGAEHMVMIDRPGPFMDAVTRFLG